MHSRVRWLVPLLSLLTGCVSLEPVGGAPERVADGELVVERWFAEPGVQEFIVTRGPGEERSLRSLTDGTSCSLGERWVRWVLSYGPADARVIRLVVSSVDRSVLEVRSLSCELVGEPITGLRSMSSLFVDGRSFGAVASDSAGQLLRIDALEGRASLIGPTDGAFGVARTTSGRFESGAEWIDVTTDPAPPVRLWNIVGGRLVVSTLGGATIGEAGDSVGWVERIETGASVLWFNDVEGLWRWAPDVGPPELAVPEACSMSGTDPFYVRIPCASGDLYSVNARTFKVQIFAMNVFQYNSVGEGKVAYTTEVDGKRRSFISDPGVSLVEIPYGGVVFDEREGSRLMLFGDAIVLHTDEGEVTELVGDLHSGLRYLSDGKLVAFQGTGETGTLVVFDPVRLTVETVAEGVPSWGFTTLSYSLSGRSLLLFLSHFDEATRVGRLEALVWPGGPRVVVEEGVSSFAQALYAEPPTLFFTRAGDDPSLWLVPL